MIDAQSGELNLPGLVVGDGHIFRHPVVQGPVVFKLKGAQGVGNALQRVLDGVGKVVHGVNAPLVPLAVVVGVIDAVDHRVAHIEVAGGQVDLGPEGHPALLKLAVLHPFKQVQGLLHGPIPVRGGGGYADGAPVLFELLRGQLAHIGQALFDQLHRELVHLVKVVGGVIEPVPPVEPQPVDVLLDGVHILLILFGGVGVVHTQVAHTAVFLGGTEVDGQRLAVADVEVAVRLRRETGVDSHALILPALSDVLVNEIVDKVLAHGNVQLFRHVCHSSVNKRLGLGITQSPTIISVFDGKSNRQLNDIVFTTAPRAQLLRCACSRCGKGPPQSRPLALWGKEGRRSEGYGACPNITMAPRIQDTAMGAIHTP